jgi:hypothetical protein
MTKLISVLIFGVLVFSQGCCFLIDGTTQDLVILSRPTGQIMNINGKRFKTPLKVPLDRNRNHYVIFPNGLRMDIDVKNEMNPTFRLTLCWFVVGILPGIVFSYIDYSTGAVNHFGQTEFMYKHGQVSDPYSKKVLIAQCWDKGNGD